MVDTIEPPRGSKASRGLETGFQRIKWIEREVCYYAGKTASLYGLVCVGRPLDTRREEKMPGREHVFDANSLLLM